MNLRQTTIRRFWLILMSLAILFHAIEAYAQERTVHQPAINIIFLDDGVVTLPEGSELRRNNWQEWRKRLPTFLRKLRMVANFHQAENDKLDPIATLYGLEVSSSLSRERTEEIVTSELYRIHDSTKRPSVILARGTAGKDQLRIVFQDSYDYPPAHAAKFLRVLAEISPAIAHRRIANNFGPFRPPPTIIFDPRTHMLSPDDPQEELPKQRWGVLEETYLLPHYVLHILAQLQISVSNSADTFYVCSIPEVGSTELRKKEALVIYAGVNSCLPSRDPAYRYQWELLAKQFAVSYEESGKGVCAPPFAIMASETANPPQVSTQVDSYLRNAIRSGKTPLIIMAPELTIEDYLKTLSPNKLDSSVRQAEAHLSQDITWTKEFSPIVLHGAKEWGYSIRIESFSHGGRMATVGTAEAGRLRSTREPLIDNMNVFNGRVLWKEVEALQKSGIVRKTQQITTEGDAFASPWSAAFRSRMNLQNIHIMEINHPKWKQSGKGIRGPFDQAVRHTLLFDLPTSTEISVEADGVGMNTTIGSLLAGNVPTSKLERALNDEMAMTRQFRTSFTQEIETGGVLFDKGNIYFLDLSGHVRRSGEKAKAAIDASGGIAGTFKEEEKTKLAVSIPVGSETQKVSGKGVSELLYFYRDVFGMNMGFLSFSLPRFWLPDNANASKFGGKWTFEPVVVQGTASKQEEVFSRIPREITLIPLETGNHLSYSYQSEHSNLQEHQRKDPVQSSDICYKSEGSSFQPELINKDGTFSWVLRHGVVISFDNSGHVKAIRCPSGDGILYIRSEGRLVEKQTSDGRSIKIEYAGQQPKKVRTNDLVSVRYEYEAGRLKRVKGKNHIDELTYDNTGGLSASKHDSRTVRMQNDFEGRLTKVTSPAIDVTLEHVPNRNMLRISDFHRDAVEWHFGPRHRIAGVIRSDTGILWTRSSEGRIIHMATGKISLTKDGYEFTPTVLVGTLP